MMLMIYTDRDLPYWFRIQSAIRAQTFCGRSLPEDTIRATWVESHWYWLVGTRNEVRMAELDALRQTVDLNHRIRAVQRKRACGCEYNRVRSWV